MYKKVFIHLFTVIQSKIFINTRREFNSQVGDIQLQTYLYFLSPKYVFEISYKP